MQQNVITFRQRCLAASGLSVLLLWFAAPTLAHVKWFTDFSYLTPPLSVPQVVTPTYRGLLVLSLVAVGVLVVADRRFNGARRVQQINGWLAARSGYGLLVMRVAMAAVLLISWSADAVLAPELTSRLPLLIWLQFIVALLLLFPKTLALGGAGVLAIYAGSIFEFGLFHMLDYLQYVGIGVFLLVSNFQQERVRNLGLPALYVTVGFSLIWLAYEKLFYPSWALYLLEQNPQLAMGFPPDLFLQGAAFIEITLGFLLLIGLLERPLAALITLVFFSTTLVFGKVEVIGHTPVHAALIVFLLQGASTVYKPPSALYNTLSRRVTFVVSSYAIVVVLFLFGYSWIADQHFHHAMTTARSDPHSGSHGARIFDLSEANATRPLFTRFEVIEESPGSYDLRVQIDNWTFTPEYSGQAPIANQGHGHIFINGAQVGRLYSEWFHLGELPPGKNQIIVTLNGNDHSDFVFDGKLVQGKKTVIVPTQ